MMKNFMKAAFVTVLAAFFFISCGSSAGEPQTQQEPETEITNPSEQYYYFQTACDLQSAKKCRCFFSAAHF